jgi:hypothetical protein
VKEESMTEQETRALEVLQEDIDNGVPNSAFKCPFALAAKRLFPGWDSVSVTSCDIVLRNWRATGEYERWLLDAEGTAAILGYDVSHGDAGMVPGTYTLTLDERRN